MRVRRRLTVLFVLLTVVAISFTNAFSILAIKNYLEARGAGEYVYDIRWMMYAGMFITVGMTTIISIAFAHYLTRPLVQLTALAAQLESGKPVAEVLERSDELGYIATALRNASDKLVEENAQLRKLNAQQQQFYADIAHETRSPLQALLSALELLELRQQEQGGSNTTYIHTAKQQVQRINRLLDDLRTLQQLEQATPALYAPFDLGAVAQQLAQSYAPQAQRLGISLNVHTAPQLVMGHREQVAQVLDNLLSNALKYTPSGGSVQLAYAAQDHALRVWVRDTGIGIAAQHIPRLTDRLFRTDYARSRDRGGSGLGLAIVASILAAHHTQLSIESVEGQGSNFAFVLATA